MVLWTTPLRFGLATMRPLKRTVRVLVSGWAARSDFEKPLRRLRHKDAAVGTAGRGIARAGAQVWSVVVTFMAKSKARQQDRSRIAAGTHVEL